MTLIDQRILIDAPPQMIWEYVSDPDKLTRWHAGYSGVSVLSTLRTGAGTRRRCTPAGGGKDVIEEITAWVDGLGYEYCLVEGGPYHSFQGRLRLQVGPDGTTVQWTVSYRPKGLFGILQNQLKGRRQLAQMMTDSLRQLRRQIDTLGVRMDESQRVKAGIQGRLDVNARAQYQRRYAPPSDLETADPVETDIPPAGDASPLPVPTAPDIPVPSFVAELEEEAGVPDYGPEADTKPRAPDGLREAIAAQPGAAVNPEEGKSRPPAPVSTDFPAPPEHITPPEPSRAVKLAQASQPIPAGGQPPVKPNEMEDRRSTPPHGIPAVEPVPGEAASVEAARVALPPQTPKHDTGEISIWEVFGVRRPSEQDDETLEALIQSVRKRRMAAKRRARPRLARRSAHVRRLDTVMGLRVWVALRTARVRLNGSLFVDED